MSYQSGGKSPRRALSVRQAMEQEWQERQDDARLLAELLAQQLPQGMEPGRLVVLPRDPSLAASIIGTFQDGAGASICGSRVADTSPALNRDDDTFIAFEHCDARGFRLVESVG